MREAIRHLVEPVRECGPDEYLARWREQAKDQLAAAVAADEDLRAWSPWDEDGESRGYRDVIAEQKTVRGMYHAAGIYFARARAEWRQCHGHAGNRDDCPGCIFADHPQH